MENFAKIIRIGDIFTGKKHVPVFCKIEWKDTKLSISGVIHPMKDGGAYSAGQISMNFQRRGQEDRTDLVSPSKITFASFWDTKTWLDFLDVWHEYHLNDLQAGCEHQRAEKWGEKKITLVKVESQTWKAVSNPIYNQLKRDFAIVESHFKEGTKIPLQVKMSLDPSIHAPWRIFQKCLESAKEGVVFKPTNESEKTWIGTNAPIKITAKEKSANWVFEKEHPEGVLCKPCPICGYKYGSAWLKKEVPESVLEFLKSLPDADKQPVWI